MRVDKINGPNKFFGQITLTLVVCLCSGFSHATKSTAFEQRIAQLESKISNLITQQKQKLSNCQLSFHYYSTVTNHCPDNTVVKNVFLLSSNGPIKLDCYYYQLQCGLNIAGTPLSDDTN